MVYIIPSLITKTVTLQILYWRLDYPHLLNEFVWQFDDIVPKTPKAHKFISFWHDSLDAVIHEATIAYAPAPGLRHVVWTNKTNPL